MVDNHSLNAVKEKYRWKVPFAKGVIAHFTVKEPSGEPQKDPEICSSHFVRKFVPQNFERGGELRTNQSYAGGGLQNQNNSGLKDVQKFNQQSTSEDEIHPSHKDKNKGNVEDTKKIPPYKVAIVKPDYPKDIFSLKRSVEKICENIREAMHHNPPKGQVKILDTFLYKGAVVVVCEDELTYNWIKTITPEIHNKAKEGFKPIEVEDLNIYYTEVSVLVKASNKLKNYSTSKFFQALTNQFKDLDISSWHLMSQKRFTRKALYRYLIDKQSLKQIECLRGLVNLETMQVEFSVSGLFGNTSSLHDWANKKIEGWLFKTKLWQLS